MSKVVSDDCARRALQKIDEDEGVRWLQDSFYYCYSPSHTFHTYMIANLRLILDVEVQAGNQSASSYSAPGLWSLLDRLPKTHWPQFIRGDCDWGNDGIMAEAEQRGMDYLFKLSQSKYVKQLILEHHCKSGWERTTEGWEALSSELKLSTWCYVPIYIRGIASPYFARNRQSYFTLS